MRGLLVAVIVAAAISSWGSGPKPSTLDLQAAHACETYFEFYRGPPTPTSESARDTTERRDIGGIP